eukprot:COSAG03_NODE_19438_length_336_cov_1.303797_1_plen_63_part_10
MRVPEYQISPGSHEKLTGPLIEVFPEFSCILLLLRKNFRPSFSPKRMYSRRRGARTAPAPARA